MSGGLSAGTAARARLAVTLMLLVLAVFWPATRNGFLTFDDDLYITNNSAVLTGLDLHGVRWALTSGQQGNWHPLTWVSHMLDVTLFGLDASRHHLTSVVLHAVNTALLYLVLSGLTGSGWPSALAAALFGLHPLHVESVAWVAERKDLLSAFFFLLTLAAYRSYVRAPSWRRFLVVLTAFALGLMAKPMLVTLPFVLLLLDWWPLGRAFAGAASRPPRALVVEKIPLFALSALSSVVTYMVQSGSGAVGSFEIYPVALRLGNALTSYVAYLGKTFWPDPLAVLYPFASWKITLASSAAAFAALLAVTVLALGLARRAPYLPVGWLWFVGTLVPVIGFVQVGVQSMADRYTYLPLAGLFIALAWGLDAVISVRRRFRPALTFAALLALAALVLVTRRQIGYWRDTTTLYEHAVAVVPDNFPAHLNLGVVYSKSREPGKAEYHLREVLRIVPGFDEAHYHLGMLYLSYGRLDEAIEEHRVLTELNPQYAQELAVLLEFVLKRTPR